MKIIKIHEPYLRFLSFITTLNIETGLIKEYLIILGIFLQLYTKHMLCVFIASSKYKIQILQ